MTSISTNVSFATPSKGSKRQSVASWIMAALAAKSSRDALRQLDASALQDIGLSQSQAQTEASRPIWDVPTSWTC
ncbi:MAG: DUF1127 domain-containing protein [Paracoccaceae bacterium]